MIYERQCWPGGGQGHILTNLPGEASYPRVYDFALDHHIHYKNIIFNLYTLLHKIIAQYPFRAYFSANIFEMDGPNTLLMKPVQYHISG